MKQLENILYFPGLILFTWFSVSGQNSDFFPRLKSLPLDSLDAYSSDHPDYSMILAEIAERRLAENTVYSRRRAAEKIRKAIDLRPENVNFRIILIRILHMQGYYDAARRESKELIKKIPDDFSHAHELADAYYYAGYTSELDAFRYLNMKSNPSSGDAALNEHVDLNLTKYADQYFKEAGQFYETAIKLNPKHRDAYLRLMMLCYEIRSYAMMLRLTQCAKNLFPRDPFVFAISGLAHYAGRQYLQSDEDYREALSRMNDDQAAGYYSIGYIVEPDQKREYQNVKDRFENRVPWMQKFWNEKDPLYGTPYNERQLEHYNRVTYANWRFGVRFQNLNGWKTERGLLYIRYGKPAEQFRIQPDDRTLGGWEIWIYPKYTFYFRDDFASGKYLLDNRSMLTLSSAYNESADKYPLPYHTIPIQAKTIQFRSGKGFTDVWFYALVDSSGWVKALSGDDTILSSGFIHNRLYKTDYTSSKYQTRQSLVSATSKFVLSFEIPSIEPDTVTRPYSMELQWPGQHAVSSSRGTLILNNFLTDSLTLSDIALCETPGSTNRENLIPLPDSILYRGKTAFLYFEIYYLTLDNEGKARYTITTRLKPQISLSLFRKLNEWLNKNQKTDISSSFDVTAHSRFDTYSLGFDLKDVPPGNYDFIVSVKDRISGKTTKRSVPVFIDE